MPKLPGREDTRKTVDSTEGLLVGSFIMEHEEWMWRRKCVIKGCDHRMGPKTDEPGWATNWKPCSDEALPSFVCKADNLDENLGMACACHTKEILDGEPIA